MGVKQNRFRQRRSGSSAKRDVKKDPYTFFLICQLSLSILLFIGAFTLKNFEHPIYSDVRESFRELLHGDFLQDEYDLSSPELAIKNILQWYNEAKNNAVDMVVALFDNINSSSSSEDEELDGMGGWMGNQVDSHNAPVSCALWPVVISARLESPVGGKITSEFGYRIHPITDEDDFHRGIDIAAASGAGIYASLPGTVLDVNSSAIYGNFITLDHGGGLHTTYAHCESIVAHVGEILRRGELIAYVGSTGISTGPHVHFEISENGVYYNPAWVLGEMSYYGN